MNLVLIDLIIIHVQYLRTFKKLKCFATLLSVSSSFGNKGSRGSGSGSDLLAGSLRLRVIHSLNVF